MSKDDGSISVPHQRDLSHQRGARLRLRRTERCLHAVNSVLNTIAYVIVGLPILLLAQCMYRQVAEPNALATSCAAAAPQGTSLHQVLQAAGTNSSLRIRTGGPAGKNEHEWFDRQYLRVGEYLRKTLNRPDDYTVVFAKPGLGYYACILLHDGDTVKDAWFEDHGD